MPDFVVQLAGVIVLVVPLVAIQWNLAGNRNRGQRRLVLPKEQQRWRLELYSNDDDAQHAIVDDSKFIARA